MNKPAERFWSIKSYRSVNAFTTAITASSRWEVKKEENKSCLIREDCDLLFNTGIVQLFTLCSSYDNIILALLFRIFSSCGPNSNFSQELLRNSNCIQWDFPTYKQEPYILFRLVQTTFLQENSLIYQTFCFCFSFPLNNFQCSSQTFYPVWPFQNLLQAFNFVVFEGYSCKIVLWSLRTPFMSHQKS